MILPGIPLPTSSYVFSASIVLREQHKAVSEMSGKTLSILVETAFWDGVEPPINGISKAHLSIDRKGLWGAAPVELAKFTKVYPRGISNRRPVALPIFSREVVY